MKLIIEMPDSEYNDLKGLYLLGLETPAYKTFIEKTCVEAIANGTPYNETDKWISVKDKLPDKNGKCLVSLDFGDVCLDSYDKEWGFVCYVGNVTHWRPLPKAPESEDK